MKICFLGAGSTIFAKNVLGDCILTPQFTDLYIALYDIDEKRLEDSFLMLKHLSEKYNSSVKIKKYTDRKESLRNADFVVNAIQVGGYKPCTVTDFEIPKKYGLRQTIGDTLGIGGIFRALRTLPVMEEFADDMSRVCPRAYFLNYVNPMAILTGYMQKHTNIKTVGLCHSVQVCVPWLFDSIGMSDKIQEAGYKIAGINHQAWLLEIYDKNGKDLYPEIKKRAKEEKYRTGSAKNDLVRFEIMDRFGYYNTESSEHVAEYSSYFIKNRYPELIERFNIPLDEYPRRCVNQIADWEKQRKELVGNERIEHIKSREYAADIIKAMVTDIPYKINGNVLNDGLIDNLPKEACVEVPCLIDRSGISPCHMGNLPEQLAALNRTNINVQLMVLEAYRTKKKEDVYMAAYLDPHTSAELSMDEIRALCDELIDAHGKWLPKLH